MDKKGHINYWLTNAKKDWIRAGRCFRDKDFVFCLFCLHLYLEKVVKAIWVKNNEDNYPPRIHNLVRLLEKANVILEEEDTIFLNDMNKFQLEGRYPDYRGKIYKECNRNFTKRIFNTVKKIKPCLLEKLQ